MPRAFSKPVAGFASAILATAFIVAIAALPTATPEAPAATILIAEIA